MRGSLRRSNPRAKLNVEPEPNSSGMSRTQKNRAARRIAREQRTIAAMVTIYCHARAGHASTHQAPLAVGLCPSCRQFLEYSHQRLASCPLAAAKPTCRVCPIQCYAPRKRQQAKEIMRYAGPRMLLRHPILALGHLCDEIVSTFRSRRSR